MTTETLQKLVKEFAEEEHSKECSHKHKLQGTGAIFYQSVGLLQCSICEGWQFIRKPVK